MSTKALVAVKTPVDDLFAWATIERDGYPATPGVGSVLKNYF